MPYDVFVYRIYIATTDELEKERRLIKELIKDWNKVYSEHKKTLILPYFSTDKEEFKEAEFDMVLGVFWTEIINDSEFLDEIRSFVKKGNPARFYFSNKDIPKIKLNLDKLQKVQDFKKEFLPTGTIKEFDSREQFIQQIDTCLNKTLKNLEDMRQLYIANEDNPEELEKLDKKKLSGFFNFISSIEDSSRSLVDIIGDFVTKSGELSSRLEKKEVDDTAFGSISLETAKIFNKFNKYIDNLINSYKEIWETFNAVFENFADNSILDDEQCIETLRNFLDQLQSGLSGAKGNLMPFSSNLNNVNSSMEFSISAKILNNKIRNFDVILESSLERLSSIKSDLIR